MKLSSNDEELKKLGFPKGQKEWRISINVVGLDENYLLTPEEVIKLINYGYQVYIVHTEPTLQCVGI